MQTTARRYRSRSAESLPRTHARRATAPGRAVDAGWRTMERAGARRRLLEAGPGDGKASSLPVHFSSNEPRN